MDFLNQHDKFRREYYNWVQSSNIPDPPTVSSQFLISLEPEFLDLLVNIEQLEAFFKSNGIEYTPIGIETVLRLHYLLGGQIDDAFSLNWYGDSEFLTLLSDIGKIENFLTSRGIPFTAIDTLPDFVSGPISLSAHYSQFYDKTIYVFGEHHFIEVDPCDTLTSDSTRAIPMFQFIERLIHKQYASGKTIDIFVETPKLIKSHSIIGANRSLIEGDELRNIEKYFADYFKLDKINLYYLKDSIKPMARFHYIDLRWIPEVYLTLTNDNFLESEQIVFELNNQVEKLKFYTYSLFSLDVERSKLIHQYILEKFSLYLEYSDEFWIKEIIDFEDIYGLTKEVKKVKDPNIKNFLKKYLDNWRQKQVRNLKKYLSDMIIQLENFLQDIEENVSELAEEFDESFLMLQTDIYTMARIFKRVSGGAPEFDNVIIYTGDAHSTFYRNVLDNFEFEVKDSFQSPDEVRCVDIREFKPFFEFNS
jgi:hypothetical protein